MYCAAAREPQRMVPSLLHLVPAAGRLLRAQHVRRRDRRELPQVSRDAGTGGSRHSSRRRSHHASHPQPTQ